MHFAVHLGGDDDLLPIREVLQGASEDLLTLPNGIDVGRIEEVDPQLERFLDDRPAVFLVKHPLVNPTFGVPKAHATEADARHIHAGVSQFGVFHAIFFSLSRPRLNRLWRIYRSMIGRIRRDGCAALWKM